jgi:two-component system cell cycle sensor histidine kinase/response regulator CckA
MADGTLVDGVETRGLAVRPRFEGELHWRAIFDNTLEGLALLDSRAVCVDANRAFAELFGRKREEIIGDPVFLHASRATDLSNAFETALRDGKAAGACTVSHLGGEAHHIGFSIFANVAAGVHLLVVRDETRERVLQDQLHQSQKMECIGRLAGGVAHDFNNMLMVIRGYGELLSNKLGYEHRLNRYVTGIIGAVDRSATITRQLLNLTRPQAQESQIVDVNAVVREAEGLLRRIIGEDIELTTSPATDLGAVSVAPAQLSQVLLNLAVNARDAIIGDGRLYIETANVWIDHEYCGAHIGVVPGAYVMISLTDSGCGMEPKLRTRIFEPFFTTKGEGKGTGLGLATVRRIVEENGGHIWVYSEKGEGTTFKIYLPRVDASRNEAHAVPASRKGSGETILVIEDEDASREIVSEFLRQNGYRVLSAHGGNDAIALCEHMEGQVDLMLSDVVMSGTSGQDFVGYLHSRNPNIKVLYMSGFPVQELIRRGAVGEADPVIQKPYRLCEVADRVYGLLHCDERSEGGCQISGGGGSV